MGAENRPGEAVAGDGSGERTTQACGSGPDVGQPDSKGGSTGKLLSPARRRRCVELARERYGISERRACRALEQPRSTQRYTATMADDEEALTMAVVRLASRYGRYGYRRVTAMLQWEGWRVNHKRVERIWRRGGLKVPAKQPKRGRLWLTDGSCMRLRPQRRNHVWAYDFVALRTSGGKPVRLLTVVDEYTRECLAIHVGRSLRSPHVIECLGTSWSSVACRSTSARTTGRSSPPGRCGCGSKGWEPQPSSSHRVALGRMGMLRASTASLGTNSWTGSSSIPSGRCRSSPSSGATSTTTNAPTAPWAIALLLQRPSSHPLLQALSVSHDLWYNYWGQVRHCCRRGSVCQRLGSHLTPPRHN